MPEHTPAPTPHRAIYGFSLYILFTALFFIYVLWAFLPVNLGLHSYLPDRYFAVFLPILVLVSIFFFVAFIYPAINLTMTPNIDEISSVVDPKLVLRDKPFTWTQLKRARPPTTTASARKKQPHTEFCKLCNETHQPLNQQQIAPLTFMDLDEINRDVYL